MEIKSKVFKRKAGKSKGKWIARIEYYDAVSGKARTMERQTDRKTDATDERDRLITELKKSHGQIQTGERMSFAMLADICGERFFKRAVIVEGRKIEGVRSYDTAQNYLTVLKQFFGKRLVGQITVESLKDYRRWRLKIGSRRKEVIASKKFVPVKLATINRELAAMRRIMRYAYAEGWITKDIFFQAKMIDTSAEIARTRRLTEAEEARLLAACQGERTTSYIRNHYGKTRNVTANISIDNPHLKAVILLAIDAGMRRGEILKLRWEDIDFQANLIRIVGTHTKTEKARLAPLTERVKTELARVREFTTGDMPFAFSEFKRSWTTAKRIAGIDDLRFHDLRRTAITRWILQGQPIALAGKIAGHTNLETTMKHYTSADADIVNGFTEKMNAIHSQAMTETAENEFLH
jgi:integrase